MMATYIGQNDGVREIVPANGGDFTPEELESLLGGVPEVIELNEYEVMIKDDAAEFYRNENHIATFVAKCNGAIKERGFISGDVIVCPREMAAQVKKKCIK